MVRIWGGDHSIFVVAFHSVQHPEERVALVVVLIFQLLLYFLGLDLGPTALAEVHVVSPEIRLGAASEADVSRLAEVAVASAAVAPEVVALGGGVVGGLVVVA